MTKSDTICAVATPPGEGAVGVVRLSGPDARRLLAVATGRSDWPARRLVVVDLKDPHSGERIDRGLACLMPGPRSYTGEDVVELQAHGSPVLLRALLEAVFVLGAEPAAPGEFTRRAVLNGRMDLSQAEAVAACIDAATLRAAHQAQRHLEGEFGHRIAGLMDELTGLVAHIEACLDFPEEEIPEPLFP